MKIIIISQYNIFSTTGGTEYYVNMLVNGLVESGHDVVFITMGNQRNKTITKYYFNKQLKYKCIFLPTINFTNIEIRQLAVSATWDEILPVLKSEEPDIVHVHTYTTFFNIRHFEKCKDVVSNLFFTAHIPAHFCPQGNLIKFNKTPCDGVLSNRCSVCLFTKGFKIGLSNLFYSYWRKVLLRLQHFNKLGVKLICVSDWQKQHALKNGFAESHIFVIRQAIVTDNYKYNQLHAINQNFTIGYLGRLSPEKGVALLLQVINKMLVKSDFRFVLGIPKEGSDLKYLSLLEDLCKRAGDRILIMDNVSANNKESFFNQIDCLLIPSFFIETGPIVLLEALLFEKQVVAPNVGGPLEFQIDFNDKVNTYHWNDEASLIQSLETVSKKITSKSNNTVVLKEKETEFIRTHESLYSKCLASS